MNIVFLLHSGEKNGANVAAIRLAYNLRKNKYSSLDKVILIFNKKINPILRNFCKKYQFNIENESVLQKLNLNDSVLIYNTIFSFYKINSYFIKQFSDVFCWIHETIYFKNKQFKKEIENNFNGELTSSDKLINNLINLKGIIYLGKSSKECWESNSRNLKDINSIIFPVPEMPEIELNSIKKLTEYNFMHYCCIGSVGPRKNQLYAIKLIENLNKEGIDSKLTIVGMREFRKNEKDYQEKLMDYIKVNNLTKIINLREYSEECFDLIDNSGTLLITSNCETFPLVIEEACLRGMNIFSKNVGEIKHYFNQNNILSSNLKEDTDKLLKFSNKGNSSIYLLEKIERKRIDLKELLRFLGSLK